MDFQELPEPSEYDFTELLLSPDQRAATLVDLRTVSMAVTALRPNFEADTPVEKGSLDSILGTSSSAIANIARRFGVSLAGQTELQELRERNRANQIKIMELEGKNAQAAMNAQTMKDAIYSTTRRLKHWVRENTPVSVYDCWYDGDGLMHFKFDAVVSSPFDLAFDLSESPLSDKEFAKQRAQRWEQEGYDICNATGQTWRLLGTDNNLNRLTELFRHHLPGLRISEVELSNGFRPPRRYIKKLEAYVTRPLEVEALIKDVPFDVY